MAKKKNPPPRKWTDDLPVVAEIRDARQLADDHWQGVDAANGRLLDVRGGKMPERLLAFHNGATLVGLIRVIPVALPADPPSLPSGWC